MYMYVLIIITIDELYVIDRFLKSAYNCIITKSLCQTSYPKRTMIYLPEFINKLIGKQSYQFCSMCSGLNYSYIAISYISIDYIDLTFVYIK